MISNKLTISSWGRHISSLTLLLWLLVLLLLLRNVSFLLQDRRGGEEADAQHPCTADGAASRWLVQQQVTAEASEDVAAYFKGNQDRRNVFILGCSGPDQVPGNLFPAPRELTSIIV